MSDTEQQLIAIARAVYDGQSINICDYGDGHEPVLLISVRAISTMKKPQVISLQQIHADARKQAFADWQASSDLGVVVTE